MVGVYRFERESVYRSFCRLGRVWQVSGTIIRHGWNGRRCWAGLALGLFLASCSVDIDNKTYPCAKHTDCGSGWVCVCSASSSLEGICVRGGVNVSGGGGSGCTVLGGDPVVDRLPACSLPTEMKYGLAWVKIPKGKFWMGCPNDSADETELCSDNEKPIHAVEITRDFWLSRTEVTQAAWQVVFPGVNPSEYKNCGDDCPVEFVTWWDAVLYCNGLSGKANLEECYNLSGLSCWGTMGNGYNCAGEPRFKGLACEGYRLPTEAEWEYAARSGTTTAIYTGEIGLDDWEECNALNLGEVAVYCGNSGVPYGGGVPCSDWRGTEQLAELCGPHPVGGKLANDYCLVDMLGNVSEWTWDWYDSYYYAALRDYAALRGQGLAKDPWGPSIGQSRVARGGTWKSTPQGCRAASRISIPPDIPYFSTGLRPARSIL
ncbi:MAG: formylglycine-generating enzyme family protein [Myxococcales bacterium]|nr:formylglycine-generating enzyme family protein [Myxococcales bacterium]